MNPSPSSSKRTLSNMIAARVLPHRFLAEQLRRPSGRFGRWVVAKALNDGNAELIGAVLQALQLQRTDRFLDVGFGGGVALRRAATLTDAALWGIDFSPDMVAQGSRHGLHDLIAAGRLNLITADVADLPLRDAAVDTVCTTNTIYFWPDLPKALAQLHRVLAPGGRLAIGFTGREKMLSFNDITQHGFRTFEPPELEAALRALSWTSIRTITLSGKVTSGDYVAIATR